MKKALLPLVSVLTAIVLIASVVFGALSINHALIVSEEQRVAAGKNYSPLEEGVSVPYASEVPADAKTVHVSPKGDDGNDGTSWDASVKTVKQAQSLIRAFYAEGGNKDAQILLDDGEYYMGTTVGITEEDVGEGNHLYIRSRNPNKATITGSKRVEKSAVKEVNDEKLGRIWKIPCSEKINQLYVNDTYATRARYPDAGEEYRVLTTDKVYRDIVIDGDNFKDFTDEDFAGAIMTVMVMWGESYLRVAENGFKRENVTLNIDGAQVERSVARVSIDGKDSAVFTRSGLEINENSRCPFHFENSKAFLNMPGEWFYDENGVAGEELTYIPHEYETLENTQLRLPTTEVLLSVDGDVDNKVENVHIEGVKFKYTANTYIDGKIGGQGNRNDNPYVKRISGGANDARPIAALSFTNVKNIAVIGNVFASLGGGALDFVSGVEDIQVEKNLFDGVGGNGVLVGPTATGMYTTKDVNGKTEIDQWVVPFEDEREYNKRVSTCNNYFNDIGWQEYSACAVIYTYAADSTVSYNTIDNVRYSGISAGWGWDTTATPYEFTKNYEISHNRISNVVNLMSDGGSIYTIGVQEGTEIHDNYMYESHDSVYCYPDGNTRMGQKDYSTAAIYLDNTSGGISTDGSGFNIYNNYLEEGIHFQDYLTVNARKNTDSVQYWKVNDVKKDKDGKIFENSGVQENGFTLLSKKAVLRGASTDDKSTATVYGYNLKKQSEGALILQSKDGGLTQLAAKDIISWTDTQITFKSENYRSGRVYYISKDLERSNSVVATLNVDRAYCMEDYFKEKWGGLEKLAIDLQTETLVVNPGKISSSSTLGFFAHTNVNDSQTASIWASADDDPWIKMDFGSDPMLIGKIVLRSRTDGGGDAESRKNLTVEIIVEEGGEYVVLKEITKADNYTENGIFVMDLAELGFAEEWIYGIRIRKTESTEKDHFLCIADIILVA